RNDRLQKSLDGGATWMSAGIVSEGEWVAVDPLDSRILYGVGSSFQRSDDGGATIASGTTSPGQVLALATSAGTPPRLYADVVEAAFRGLYVSADRGVSWSRTTSIPGGLEFLFVSSASGSERILAGGGTRGVFESDDGGTTWTARSVGLRASRADALAVFPSDGRIAYASGSGFARTTDGGATWQVDPFAPLATGGALAVDPTNADIVYASAET